MVTRKFPPTFIGTNLLPTEYLSNGFTLYEGGSTSSTKIVKICTLATAGFNTLQLNNVSEIAVGQFVTGVNIPVMTSLGEPTVVKSIDAENNLITLNANVNLNIQNLNVYFFNAQTSIEYVLHNMAGSGIESVRTSVFWSGFEPTAPTNSNGVITHNINWNDPNLPHGDKYIWFQIESYLKLASEVGIQIMPRFGDPPNWAMDWDYKIDNNNLFSFNDPETKTQLKNKGVKVYATGNNGDSFIMIDDLKRGCLLLPNMIISGNNIPSDTRIKSLTRINDNWQINLSKNLSGIVNGYVIGTIINYELNNVINGVSKKISATDNDVFQFDSIDDVVIFVTNLQRKGGSIPVNYNDFANFMNQFLLRFGTSGTFWNNLNNDVLTTTSASSNVNSTQYAQTINLNTNLNTANVVVGMVVESLANGSVPSTRQDGSNSYIPPDAKICAINGSQIIINKPLNKNIPANVSVKFTFPKMINYQIWNECDSAAYGEKNYPANFKFKIGSGSTIYTINKSYLVRGANWPFHPSKIKFKATYQKNNKFVVKYQKTSSVKDYAYEFTESFIDFIKIIKKEMHDVDPNANAVSNAVTNPKQTYPKIFKIKNGKYAYDKFGINKYPINAADLILEIQSYKNIFQAPSAYNVPTVNNPSCPNLILSEYGWSTDLVGFGSTAKSEDDQNSYINRLFDWNSSKVNFKNVIQFSNWIIEHAMYFKWASNETSYTLKSSSTAPGAGAENERGIYRYKNAAHKTGTLNIVANANTATFSDPVPNSWIVGSKVYASYGDNGSNLTKFKNGAQISNISDDRKTITFNITMPYSINTILFNGANSKNGTSQSFLYTSLLEKFIQITQIDSALQGSEYLLITTKYNSNVRKNESVLIKGIIGTNNNKYNGLYTVNNIINNNQFLIFNNNGHTQIEINNLDLANAAVVVSLQPKSAAVTHQKYALYNQGRSQNL